MDAALPVVVRSFVPADAEACRRLYREGLLGGQLSENDTALDIDDIQAAYMDVPGNHFWVAQLEDGTVVGTIGVQQHDDGVGEMKRLRVRADLRRRGIGSRLMETALKFCADQNYLKITLDTFVEREAAIKLFEKFHFRHNRTRNLGGKELLYFYLDLYGGEKQR